MKRFFLATTFVLGLALVALAYPVDVPCAVCGRAVMAEPLLARFVPECERFTGFVHPGQCFSKQDPEVRRAAGVMYRWD